ncbi:hypothetical protein [Pigmentiphaga daeguensis]|uniref:Uncharacterized protein n=1 Tax=Pigmentiphaga daeguensis TaxID=414049 RepID=A0ABN1BBB0_9BURK
MTQPKQRTLARAAGYLCTRIVGHAASTLRNPGGTDVALHLHGEEVAPVTTGGYGVVPVSLGTIVLTQDQARAIAQSLLAAADSAGSPPAPAPEPTAPVPSAPTAPRAHGKARARAKA